jgi:hypothetical protein
MGMTVPVTIEDQSVTLKQADEKYRWLSSQYNSQNAKAGFYQAMERTPPKTQDLLDLLQQATMMGDNERAQELRQITQASENKRKDLIADIRKRYEDQASDYTKEMNTLRPLVDKFNENMLSEGGINVEPKMSDKEFKDKFIAQKNSDIMAQGRYGQKLWDPNKPEPWQLEEFQNALKAYRAGR